MTEQNITYSGEIITRQDAKAAGQKRYFTGKPCPHGHVAERFVSSHCCAICTTERHQKSQRENIDLHRSYSRKCSAKRRALFPELARAEARKSRRKVYWENPEVAREKARIKFKKLSGRRRQEKAGRPKPFICEACGDPHKVIVFDHCHASGKFRGWICSPCNLAIGLAKDSPEKLIAMAKYLENIDV